MARVEETEDVAVASSENEEKKDSPEADPPKGSEAEDDEESDEGSEEEEYEIEAIIDAKRGYFQKGKFGYLVKWKGYGSEHNSWVREEDAGNASELIKDFWALDHQKKNARKSIDVKGKEPASNGKRARSTMSKDRSPPPDSAKRGKSKAANPESEDEVVSDDDEEKKLKKKPRKSVDNGKTKRKSLTALDQDGEGDIAMADDSVDATGPEEQSYASMEKHMHLRTWDPLVKDIDTVERTDDDGLVVYFTTNDGLRMREKSTLCGKKFPQKLLKFYESNLRWKAANQPEQA